jgi:hypothetical protein
MLMTAKQKILTGGAVLMLTGLPVYQQTRINALSERVATLMEAGTRVNRAATPVLAAVSNETPSTARTPAAAGDKERNMDGRNNGTGKTVAKVIVPGPGEASFSKRGDAVILDSFKAADPKEDTTLYGTGFLPGNVTGLTAPQTPAGHVNWDHAQATGAPDTTQAGDRPTAWAPRSPKSGEQWLKLGYDKPVEVKEINVHESYNSGAISKVTAFLPDGSEKTLWTGNAARGSENEIQETSIPVPAGITSNQIKVYLDTNRVESWPEIDAVELVGRNGSRQWASSTSASSSYSETYSGQAGLETTTRSLGGRSSGSPAQSTSEVLDLGAGRRPAPGPAQSGAGR